MVCLRTPQTSECSATAIALRIQTQCHTREPSPPKFQLKELVPYYPCVLLLVCVCVCVCVLFLK